VVPNAGVPKTDAGWENVAGLEAGEPKADVEAGFVAAPKPNALGLPENAENAPPPFPAPEAKFENAPPPLELKAPVGGFNKDEAGWDGCPKADWPKDEFSKADVG